jgi:hypothetical protein
MVPLWSFMSPNVGFHVQADNWDYSPMTEWGQGDLRVERRVRQEVASDARQIGLLCEAVLEIAREMKLGTDPADAGRWEALRRLQGLADMVEEIKERCAAASGEPALRPIRSNTVRGPDAPAPEGRPAD